MNKFKMDKFRSFVRVQPMKQQIDTLTVLDESKPNNDMLNAIICIILNILTLFSVFKRPHAIECIPPLEILRSWGITMNGEEKNKQLRLISSNDYFLCVFNVSSFLHFLRFYPTID